jgi:hypothetical protein
VEVLEVGWEGGGTELEEYVYFYGKVNENHELGTGLLSCIRESYQQLRC